MIGKTLAVGKQGDAKTRESASRRASDASLADVEPSDKLGKDVQPMMRQYRKVLAKGRSSSGERHISAPTSPVICSPDVEATTDASAYLLCKKEVERGF